MPEAEASGLIKPRGPHFVPPIAPEGAEFLRPKQVATMLGVTEATLSLMRHEGTGPRFCRWRRAILYHRDDIQAFITARMAASTAEADRNTMKLAVAKR